MLLQDGQPAEAESLILRALDTFQQVGWIQSLQFCIINGVRSMAASTSALHTR